VSDEPYDGPTFYRFRCDDRTGFEFRILVARDGDFHLSIHPVAEDLAREQSGGSDLPTDDAERFAELQAVTEPYAGLYSASVRIRMPMIGGGSHAELWDGIAKIIKQIQKKRGRKNGR
jgi:hypothetical protein